MTFRETVLRVVKRDDETFALARAQILTANILRVEGGKYARRLKHDARHHAGQGRLTGSFR
jgi:hypothetical protein